MTTLTNVKEQQAGKDRPRTPVAVPPAYPDPESWRRFGLLRRQLQRNDRLPFPAPGATGKSL